MMEWSMKHKKYKSFNLGPHKIKIRYVKNLVGDDNKPLYGLIDFSANTILICTHFNNVAISQDVIDHSLSHEIMHCIMNYLNMHELNANEVFVDTVSGSVLNVIKTLK